MPEASAARELRPVQYTVAPASPNASAMPRPTPRVAPATSATRPLRVWFADSAFAACFARFFLEEVIAASTGGLTIYRQLAHSSQSSCNALPPASVSRQ